VQGAAQGSASRPFREALDHYDDPIAPGARQCVQRRLGLEPESEERRLAARASKCCLVGRGRSVGVLAFPERFAKQPPLFLIAMVVAGTGLDSFYRRPCNPQDSLDVS